jgi:phosphoheptose isomerase
VAAQLEDVYRHLVLGRSLVPAEPRDERESASHAFRAAAEAIELAGFELLSPIMDAAARMTRAVQSGGKLLICGNGGSAAEAQHLAAEFVGQLVVRDRRGLPAIALTTDTAILTAWANDRSYEDVFRRQVEALGRPGDVLIGFSTSGNSPNVVEAFRFARSAGIETVLIGGRGGGELAPLADVSIVVPSDNTQRIQEVHAVVVHVLAELVERRLAVSDAASGIVLELAS